MFCTISFFEIKLYCKCCWVIQFKGTPLWNPQMKNYFFIICPLLSICVHLHFHRLNLSKLPLQCPISHKPRFFWILCVPTKNHKEANSCCSTSHTSINRHWGHVRKFITLEHQTELEPTQKESVLLNSPWRWAELSDTFQTQWDWALSQTRIMATEITSIVAFWACGQYALAYQGYIQKYQF